ncbi:MAG: HEAT repeat domain-containing protein, partial [Planctomycetota bacterium]|nr:HEAT repeat domain-containing protein [Planctomycetota bacterium]
MARRWVLCLVLLSGTPAVGRAQEDLEGLVKALGDPSTRTAARSTLSRRKDPDAIAVLLEAMPEFGLCGQRSGFYVLGRYPRELARPALHSLTQTDDPYLRLHAATVLYLMRELNVGAIMAEALKAEEVSTETRVAMLGRLYGVRPFSPPVQEACRALLRPEENTAVINGALHCLLRALDMEAMPACRKLLDHASPDVRALAATLLYRFGDAEQGSAVANALRSDNVGFGQIGAILRCVSEMHGTVRGSGILDATAELLTREDLPSPYRREALLIFRNLAHAGAIPVLLALLDDDQASAARSGLTPLIRLALISALRWQGDRKTLEALLDHEDPEVAKAARAGLVRLDKKEGKAAGVARPGKKAEKAAVKRDSSTLDEL